jgi:hypothetical protein
MAVSHTQGPWRIVSDGISHWIEIEPNKIALIHAKKADRDLIAAAPDLLAALQEVLSLCEGECAIGHICLNAIAKAKSKAKGGA